MNITELEQIINDAPDGATHVSDNGVYYRMGAKQFWWARGEEWVETEIDHFTRSLSDIKEIVELQKENEELRAHINELRNEVDYPNICGDKKVQDSGGDTVCRYGRACSSCDDYMYRMDILNKTPKQSLVDIQANAIEEALKKSITGAIANEPNEDKQEGFFWLHGWLEHYANKLREGSSND